MSEDAEATVYGNPDLPEGTEDRPLVTFALFAYNQEQYIREAVEGAFSQTYSPLEIILSDDCSSDKTFEIMQEMAAAYEGPHEVRVLQSTQNLGVVAHVNSVIKESRGQYIVMAAGDDISVAGRTKESVCPMIKDSKICFVEVDYKVFYDLDRDNLEASPSTKFGLIDLNSKMIDVAPPTKGAVRAYRKSPIELYPPLSESCPTEDTPMVMRLLYEGYGLRVTYHGCLLRRHVNNLSNIGNFKEDHWQNLLNQFYRDAKFAVARGVINQDTAEKVMQHFYKRMHLSNASMLIGCEKNTIWKKTSLLWNEEINLSKITKIRLLLRLLKRKLELPLSIARRDQSK